MSSSDDGDFALSGDEYVPKSLSSTENESTGPVKAKSIKRKKPQPRQEITGKALKKPRLSAEKVPWTPRSTRYMEHKVNRHIFVGNMPLPGKVLLEEARTAEDAPSPIKRRIRQFYLH